MSNLRPLLYTAVMQQTSEALPVDLSLFPHDERVLVAVSGGA
jgi:hypothetical protein